MIGRLSFHSARGTEALGRSCLSFQRANGMHGSVVHGPVLAILLLVCVAALGCERTTFSVVSPDDPRAPAGSEEETGDPEPPSPPGDPGSPEEPGGRFVHPSWPVTLPDGAVVTDLEVKSDRLKYRIRTDSDYEDIYDRMHPELVDDGWEREDLESKKHGVEAEYERGDLELEVKVERDGEDRVKIDLELDD